MKEITKWLNESIYLNSLSSACEMCAKGSKMVILVTGLCPSNCFYCPLSFKKGGKDLIYADEWKLSVENDTKKLIKEAELINAEGAGITGGDPLIVWQRTIKYIKLLKKNFGGEFNIHLYTSAQKNSKYIPKIVEAGLDEIRFHPFLKYWSDMDKSPLSKVIKKTKKLNIEVTIEIPSIPNMNKELFSLVKWSEKHNLDHINLNELEFSERNCNNLLKRNYELKNEISAGVLGSQKTAYNIIKLAQSKDYTVGIHYCSVSFKDGIQLKNRIKRRAKNIVKDFEVISKEGTIIKGAIDLENKSKNTIMNLLTNKFKIPKKFIFLDKEKNQIEVALWILEEISNRLKKEGYKSYLIEEYPTADRLEVERIPLPIST